MRITRIFLHCVSAALILGCGGDTTDPGTPNPTSDRTTIVLDFCSKGVPDFFAYRNEGETWTRLLPDANGSFTFEAAPKVAITLIDSDGIFETFYASAQDLKILSGSTCQAQGEKTLNGSFANIGSDSYAVITAGISRASSSGAFTLASVPDGRVDLLAINYRHGFTTNISPTEVIIRRDLQPVTGTQIPAFDFASTEAASFSSNSLTVNGLLPGDASVLYMDFRSANGTTQELGMVEGFSGAQFRSIPGSLLKEGDLHSLRFVARGGDFTFTRGVVLYYRQPTDKTVTLGPKLNPATFAVVASAPFMRIRGTMASQPEYSAAVRFVFSQGTSANGERDWFITGTRDYFGGTTPSTWELEIPDLSAVPGFPLSAGFESNQRTRAAGEAFSDLLWLWIGRPPTDGASLRYAQSPIVTISPQ